MTIWWSTSLRTAKRRLPTGIDSRSRGQGPAVCIPILFLASFNSSSRVYLLDANKPNLVASPSSSAPADWLVAAAAAPRGAAAASSACPPAAALRYNT